MKNILFFLIFVISGYGYGLSASNGNVSDNDNTGQNSLVTLPPNINGSLKKKYIPPKIRICKDTLRIQKSQMKKWKRLVKENRQTDGIEALEKAARYKCGEACYKLGEIYKSNDRIKSDSLFYYSAVYGYKSGIAWLNSSEGVFALGTDIYFPQYPGGEKALISYLYEEAKKTFRSDNGVVEFQGRVIVKFIIEKDGSIKYAKVIKNTTLMPINKYAINIITNMQKWKPALWKGQPVRSFFICPIVIRLMM